MENKTSLPDEVLREGQPRERQLWMLHPALPFVVKKGELTRSEELARRAVAFLFELEGVQVAVLLCTPSGQFFASLKRLGSVCTCESSNAPDLGRLASLGCTAGEA